MSRGGSRNNPYLAAWVAGGCDVYSACRQCPTRAQSVRARKRAYERHSVKGRNASCKLPKLLRIMYLFTGLNICSEIRKYKKTRDVFTYHAVLPVAQRQRCVCSEVS